MPPRRSSRAPRRRRQRGRGIMDFISKAGKFLKDSKLISTVGNALGQAGIPLASQIGSVAGSLGFGRSMVRRRRGGALKLAGGMRRRCR